MNPLSYSKYRLVSAALSELVAVLFAPLITANATITDVFGLSSYVSLRVMP